MIPHYFSVDDVRVSVLGLGPLGTVAVVRYVNQLVRRGVLAELRRKDGVTVYACGPAVASWFAEAPKTRPGGNSGRYRLEKAKREVQEQSAWRRRVEQLRASFDGEQVVEAASQPVLEG